MITRKINLGLVGEVSNYNGDMRTLIQCMNTENITPVDGVDIMDTHSTEYIGSDTYLIYTRNGVSKIYKQIPIVHNDDTFRWTERKWNNNRKAMFAEVDKGMFKFCCTAYTDTGEGLISIYMKKYMKRNGKIKSVRIVDKAADNEAFLDGINGFIRDFVNDVMYQFDIPKGSNYPEVQKGECL